VKATKLQFGTIDAIAEKVQKEGELVARKWAGDLHKRIISESKGKGDNEEKRKRMEEPYRENIEADLLKSFLEGRNK